MSEVQKRLLGPETDWQFPLHQIKVITDAVVTAGTQCPFCGAVGNWRRGAHFDHEMLCGRGCGAPAWEPGEACRVVEFVVHTQPGERE